MNIEILSAFFMWCTVINGSLLMLWTVMSIAAPDIIYRMQSRFFPIPREAFNVVFYCFIGLFKIVFLVLNLVPWIALLIIG